MADITPPDSPTLSASSPADSPSTTHAEEPSELQEHQEQGPAPRIEHVVRPNDTHRCPIHELAADCMGVYIKPENEEITSRLVGPITITTNGASEMLRAKTRGKSKMLPAILYRTFYEGSATLSSRVSKDTHVRHRENQDPKLHDNNAFQTVGKVNFECSLTKEGVERHLVWNKKKNPSTWISMFDEYSHARRRAEFHYNESKRIGQRVTIAEISTVDLVPATIHANCQSIWEICTKNKYFGKHFHSTVTTRPVAIPIWVHRSIFAANTTSVSPEQLMALCADLFVCIKELRVSNLVEGPKTHSKRRTITADGHNYEWLALGRIHESRIMKVIPFDGSAFHLVKPSYTVRSAAATDDWIFDFDGETWRLESEMNRSQLRKRKRNSAEGKGSHTETSSKTPRLSYSLITTIH